MNSVTLFTQIARKYLNYNATLKGVHNIGKTENVNAHRFAHNIHCIKDHHGGKLFALNACFFFLEISKNCS